MKKMRKIGIPKLIINKMPRAICSSSEMSELLSQINPMKTTTIPIIEAKNNDSNKLSPLMISVKYQNKKNDKTKTTTYTTYNIMMFIYYYKNFCDNKIVAVDKWIKNLEFV